MSAPSIVVRRGAAFGDAVAATCVADKLIDQGYPVIFQTFSPIHSVIRLHPRIADVTDNVGFCHVNLDRAYEDDPHRPQRHFHDMYFDYANRDLGKLSMSIGKPVNCKPHLVFPAQREQTFYEKLRSYPKPWLGICPRSNNYLVRQIPDYTWTAVAAGIHGTCFWLGNHAPAPVGIVDLGIRDVDRLTGFLATMDFIVSVDTGPLHIAAALGTRVLAINQSNFLELRLNDQNDYVTIAPPLNCLNCQKNVCPKNNFIPPCSQIEPSLIITAANAISAGFSQNKVSALIPTYNADAHRLNRCIEAILPQVEEVILSLAADGALPSGVLAGPKIKVVRHRLGNLGFGKNCNFGFRNTTHNFVMLLNDDVFLEPGVVNKLMAVMTSHADIGGVSHLLRYPGGSIQYGGKYRDSGAQGWFHASHRKWESELKTLTEQEVVCGASVLLRRSAFYDADGFDERFHMYAEDDDLSMRIRRAGWRLFFLPDAVGIHEESMSTRSNLQKYGWIYEGNKLMRQLWKPYWDHNKNCTIGNFNYLYETQNHQRDPELVH